MTPVGGNARSQTSRTGGAVELQNTHMRTHTHKCLHTHKDMHTHTNTHTHTHTLDRDIYTHTFTRAFSVTGSARKSIVYRWDG